MGLGNATSITTTTGAYFIPELWSDEIAVRYKANLVLANLVETMDHSGKYGDVIHIPTSTRGSAAAHTSQGDAITFAAPTTNEMQITINQWWVRGVQIPDLVDKQALPSMRKFIVDDLGYSLAVAVDDYLWDSVANLLQGASSRAGAVIADDGTTAWNPAANTNTGNATHLTDAGIRRLVQNLDDLDVPGTDRYFAIAPIEKRYLLGLPRFTEQAFVGDGASIRNGMVGNLYGSEVYVTSNATQFNATDASTAYRQGVYAHRSAMILVNQIKPRVQAQYKVEYLSDALVADVAFGAAKVKTENSNSYDRGVVFIYKNS